MGIEEEYKALVYDLHRYEEPPRKSPYSLCDPAREELPTKSEIAMALVLHWMRSRKKDLAWCQRADCFPGPTGNKNKKGWWMPAPHEGCMCPIIVCEPIFKKEDTKVKVKWNVEPFAWLRHCKTYEHCLFLIQNKRLHRFRVQRLDVTRLAAHILMNTIPLLVDESDSNVLSKSFLLDCADGKVDTDIDNRIQSWKLNIALEELDEVCHEVG